MSDDTPKRRQKISYRIPKAREDEFDRLVKLSGQSINGFITDSIFRRGRRSPAQQIRLVQILDETARIKSGVEAGGLESGEITRELTLIRTALMSLIGRQT
jgi:uncharacterized protein (DUF1778 family)